MTLNYLEKIVANKRSEVELLKSQKKGATKLIRSPLFTFSKALRKRPFSVIAEVKRRSPSKGIFSTKYDISSFIDAYIEGGASAISVLTDSYAFGGSIEDLEDAAKLSCGQVPLLRKDFIVDPYQIIEAAAAGASAVLIIVAVLSESTKEMIAFARSLGMDALVEVNNEEELALALDAAADIIGINHRNLKTFEIDMALSERLIKLIPENVIKVAASGMKSAEDAERMRQLGFDAILVGESLMKAAEPKKLLLEMGGVL